MNIPKIINEIGSLEDYGCEINKISVDELFQQYEGLGFIYPEKKKRLEKIMPVIKNNWKKVLKIPNPPIKIVTCQDSKGAFGTMVILKSTNHGALNHHGIGNKLHISALAFLTSQKVLLADEEMKTAQLWFRPSNRIMNHICGSGNNNIPDDFSFNRTFNYLELDPKMFLLSDSKVEKYRFKYKDIFEKFILKHRGKAFLKGEELDSEDVELNQLNQVYKQVGLERYRRIWLAFDHSKSALLGVAIAYKSPVGMNFSFLDNRCELIISPSIDSKLSLKITTQLLGVISSQYIDFLPGFIPLITENSIAKNVIKLGGKFVRKYTQHLWTQEGFNDCYFGAISAVKNILLREHNQNFPVGLKNRDGN